MRARDDRAGAERARAELHAAGIDRARLAGADEVDRGLDRTAGEPPHAGERERVVDAPVVVLPEIDVVEPVAVAQPGLGAVALVQEGERAPTARPSSPIAGKMKTSSSGSVSASSRLSRTLANRPPASASLRAPVRSSHQRTDCSGEILRDLLDRGRDGLAVVALAERRGTSRASRTSC